MAYAEKYFHQFCKPSGKVCRISIQKRDYVGSSIELEGQPDPILISYDNSDEFKFKPIIPSTAEIFLTFGTGNGVNFSEFWEADEKTFKIVYTVDGEIEWVGFVLLEGFAYELAGGVYYAQITATDGLGTLESILFKDQNTGQKYGLTDLTYNDGFKFPLILVATEILRKLELDLDLWTLVDVYEQNQTDRTSNTRNSDPLAITQVNVKTYINGSERNDVPYYKEVDEAWDCKKVMENLLYVMCGSQLFQENGKWKIKRFGVDAKYGLPYPLLTEGEYFYKATFNSDTNQSFDPINSLYDTNLDIYTTVDVNDLAVGIDCFNLLNNSTPASQGHYKLTGLGIILKIDVLGKIEDIITYDKPVYKWHKYNTLSSYLGSEELNNTIFIPCKDTNKFLLGNDHVLRMDDLYKQFRVNYEYSYLKDGDSPDNLIINGNFEQNYNQYGGIEAPPNWDRIRWGSKSKYLRLRTEDIPLNERIYANGNTKALVIGKQYNDLNISNKSAVSRNDSAIRQNNIIVTKDEDLLFRAFIRYNYRPITSRYYPMFRIFLVGSDSCYFLINDYKSDENLKYQWSEPYKLSLAKKWDDGSIDLRYSDTSSYSKNNNPLLTFPDFMFLTAKQSENYDENLEHDDRWYEFNFKLPKVPESGQLAVYIHGLASSIRYFLNSKYNFRVLAEGNKSKYFYAPNPNLVSIEDIDMHLASINIGKTYTEDEAIPSEDYIYANENVNYTDQREPIEIFNGDTEDEAVQSSLIVPANNTGNKNKWDTSNNDFGKSDLGLILCKSVMKQYGKPSRLLEGGVSAEDATYGTRFLFEAIPNTYFMLLRGKFNPIRGYIEDATFAQISNASIKKGGIINGDNLDPLWLPTGNIRCVKDLGLNTGFYEEEEQDSNRNSETFGVLRWVLGGEDNVLCPLNEPSKYYWGCDDSSFELSNMTDYTVLLDENGLVTVNYNQDGGKYIYFIHLASLGTVNRVANDFQYNIIDSFQYLSDITINGYLYRVLRQDFVTSEMTDFSQTFDFN